jgi:hypothetical protein
MKKLLSTILITLVLVSTFFAVIKPSPVFAASADLPTCVSFTAISVGACFTELSAWMGNLALTLASTLVAVSGTLLNFSIKLTLDISSIYDRTPAIGNTWIVIRNLSSIFIIFTLLYTSILTILDLGKTNVKDLVLKIIIAGLLINFSLFFTKAAIDASNLVSMQFYRALAPEYVSSLDGGLSDVFMGSLKLQNIYHPDKSALAAGAKSETDIFVSIIIATYGGTILMLFAAISFLAAAVAFAIRTAVLIFLLAFSPVFFVGMIFPEIKKDISDEWLSMLKGQLIFMPVYLLLMYVAMTLITDPGFMSFIQSSKPQGAAGSATSFIYNQIGIVVQYVIAIVFINVPLIAAVKMGAMGTKFADGMVKGLKDRIYAQPKALGGVVGRNTLGKLGGALGSSFDSMAARADASNSKILKLGSSVLRTTNISQNVRGGLSKMEKGKYGSNYSNADISKEDKERAREIVGIQRAERQQNAIKAALANNASDPAIAKTFADEVGKMTGKEIESVKFNTLMNDNFITQLSSSQFDKLIESDKLNDQQKGELRGKRAEVFGRILAPNSGLNGDQIKNKVKLLTGKDLSKLTQSIFQNNSVLDALTPSQLEDMKDMDAGVRAAIGTYISGQPRNSHKAQGFIRKNINEWS